ncbi:hypothetical protein RYH80_18775 [Halobaculum sp. MBLA0147]|uniref:hypothetical protein n=1 Tax=Halobaculum sp. MBLA0147 TaxID=3079934 RepID=UPI0035253012
MSRDNDAEMSTEAQADAYSDFEEIDPTFPDTWERVEDGALSSTQYDVWADTRDDHDAKVAAGWEPVNEAPMFLVHVYTDDEWEILLRSQSWFDTRGAAALTAHRLSDGHLPNPATWDRVWNALGRPDTGGLEQMDSIEHLDDWNGVPPVQDPDTPTDQRYVSEVDGTRREIRYGVRLRGTPERGEGHFHTEYYVEAREGGDGNYWEAVTVSATPFDIGEHITRLATNWEDEFHAATQ